MLAVRVGSLSPGRVGVNALAMMHISDTVDEDDAFQSTGCRVVKELEIRSPRLETADFHSARLISVVEIFLGLGDGMED